MKNGSLDSGYILTKDPLRSRGLVCGFATVVDSFGPFFSFGVR
jgi:hypothetical protein